MVESTNSAIPLPDIKEARTKKMIEEELARMEQEKLMSKPKIKRSDKEAFTKVRESVIVQLITNHTTCLVKSFLAHQVRD